MPWNRLKGKGGLHGARRPAQSSQQVDTEQRPVESEAGYDPGDNWDRVSKQGTAGANALRRDCTWRD